MEEFNQADDDGGRMDTFLVNPGKKKGKGKSHKKGGGKKHRRNPGNPKKRRGTHRRGHMRNNPGFGYFVPGGLGALVFRAGLKMAGGDTVRDADGTLSTKALGIAALALYFGDNVASFLRQQGSDSIAFQGGMAGTAVNLLVDEKAPDFAKEWLLPMSTTAGTITPAGASHGLAGLGADRAKPLSMDMYQALAGLGVLPRIGAVVYVQGADGRVYEVPTSSGATAGMGAGDSIEIPAGVGPGAVIRQKSTGRRFRILRDTSTGQVYAELLSGVGATIDAYQRAS